MRFVSPRRAVSCAAATLLAVTGLVAVQGAGPASAAVSTKLYVSYGGKVIKNETVYASAAVPPAVSRTVKLQYRKHKSSGSWKTFKTFTVNAGNGGFEAPVSFSSSRYIRHYVPKVGSRSAVVGTARKITVVPQTVDYFGATPASQCTNYQHRDVTVFVRFLPVRAYRSVIFETNVADLEAVTDTRGIASVTFDPGLSTFDYVARAHAGPRGGAALKSSSGVTYGQDYCDL